MFSAAEYNQLSAKEAKLLGCDEVVCRPSQESYSGRGVFFLSKTDEWGVDAFSAEKGGGDYVAQKLARQRAEPDKARKGSLNCVRVRSLLRKGGVDFHQFNNGPLFGDLTERVLDEVFHGRKK